jgi:DNA polymerase (family X)
MNNHEIARVLDEIADMLEILGENFFRVRAYRNAARVVADYPAPIASLDADALDSIPGIGADLAGKILTLIGTGELEMHRELQARVPAGILELRAIRGLGPKRIKILAEIVKVTDRASLKRAAEAGALRGVRGLGKKLEDQMLAVLAEENPEASRILYSEAERIVAELIAHLKNCAGIDAIEPAGSFRRRRDTIGDLDLLVASHNAAPVMDQLLSFPKVTGTLGKGETKSSVLLSDGLQVDLRVVEPQSFAAALMYFTGSKAHNVHLRRIAQAGGMLLNEYGLFRGDEAIAARSEEDLYRALGIDFVPPELREDRGEVEAAREHRLPRLIARDDLRGDLHTHSTWTDGRASIAEMARAARAAGLEYFALTDHSQRLAMARGLDPARLREQWKEIDATAHEIDGIKILRGIEVDILEDGNLDLPDDTLVELDWVVASVHSKFDQDPRTMTRRMVKAIRNPNVDVIGHPSGRMLNKRLASQFDLDAVLKVAREEGCALEVDSQPARLDLNDTGCLAAKHAGVKLVVSSDSHHPSHFAGLAYGINQARRGWIEPSEVLNTRPLSELRQRR